MKKRRLTFKDLYSSKEKNDSFKEIADKVKLVNITSNTDQGRADVGPMSDQGRADVGPMSDQGRADVGPMSDQGRADVGPMSDQGRADVGPMSDQGRADVGPMSDQGRADVEKKLSLSRTQTLVYLWLKSKGQKGEFDKEEITVDLPDAAYITIRRSLNILKKYRIIKLKFDRSRNIYEYIILTFSKVKKTRIGARPMSDQGRADVGPRLAQDQTKVVPMLDQDWHKKKYTSSSVLNLLETTTDPELNYWKQQGLTEKQFQLWLTTANCDEETMLRYLAYCRFEMVDLNFEESKPIDNVFNWFFKILEKTGGYPKPKGYKSFEEKRLEEEREVAEEKKRLAAEKEKIYRDRIKAERDAAFFEILANPESALYKKCFEKLNEFNKKRVGKKSFEIAMRSAFDEIMEEE